MNKNMILFNATFVSEDKIDGFVRYTLEILKRIKKENILFVTNRKIIEKYNLSNYIEVPLELSEDNRKANIKRLLWYQTKLNHYIDKYNIKVFYSPIPEGIIFPSVKQIITIHDIIPLIYPKYHRRFKYYYKYLLKIMVKNSSKIITVSENSKKAILETYNLKKENIFIASPSIDKSKFYPRDKTSINETIKKYRLKDKYILYVGVIRIYKNVERLIRAFNKINRKDVDLVIIGKFNKNTLYLKDLVKDLGIEDNVKFIEFVPDEDLTNLLSGASLFVLPSLYEGFGIPPLEAMACGTPVVVSKIGSLTEVCGNASYYVNPYDIDDIAKGLNIVLTDEKLREELIKKGFERIKKFSWENTVKTIEKIIGI